MYGPFPDPGDETTSCLRHGPPGPGRSEVLLIPSLLSPSINRQPCEPCGKQLEGQESAVDQQTGFAATDGELMATSRHADRRTRTARPWWRPAAYSAAATAAIAALFTPVPALADPGAGQAPSAPIAVPDPGARPMALGTLQMPGQTT